MLMFLFIWRFLIKYRHLKLYLAIVENNIYTKIKTSTKLKLYQLYFLIIITIDNRNNNCSLIILLQKQQKIITKIRLYKV